jgi:hypothetical protein
LVLLELLLILNSLCLIWVSTAGTGIGSFVKIPYCPAIGIGYFQKTPYRLGTGIGPFWNFHTSLVQVFRV